VPTHRHAVRASLTVAALATLLLTLVACGGGSEKATKTTTAPKLQQVTTTAPAATAPPTTAGPTEPTTTHVEAADRLFNAWQAHNRADALKVAVPEAVDTLFAQDPSGWYEYTYGNELGTFCDTGEFDEGTCNYRDDNDHYAKVQLTHDARGWQVVEVTISSNEGQG
jgi:hypothetical protein